MKPRKIFLAINLLLMLFIGATLVSAQTINGTISGTVTDAQNAIVPGANVNVTNNNTGLKRDTVTNDEGRFSVVGLAVGIYTVRVEKSGFAAIVRNDVNVSVGIETELNLSLEAGQLQAQVEVTTAGELLDTTQSQVAKTVDSQKILELPGRNSLNGLALLNPGVLPNQNGRPGSGFAVNGNRTRSNNFTIDGANNNDQSLSIPRQNLPPEALAEFQIITNTPSAEFGRNAGSYVNQITRSGTNDFSGAVFYQYAGNRFNSFTTAQERVFNANRASVGDYLASRRARNVTVDNTFGATLGGPIRKNHTFFFASYDGNKFRTTIGASQRPALDAASRALLIANRANFASQAAVDFILNTFPVANDQTLASTSLSASTVNVGTTANPIPLVFRTFNRTLDQGLAYGNDFNRFLGKIDTKINDKDRLSFRYLYSKFNDPGSPASLPGLEIGQVNTDQSFTVNDAYILTSNLLNEFRFTYSQRDISFPEELTAFAGGAQLQINGTFGAFNGGNANFPQFRNDKVLEFTDNVTYTTGDHGLKFGYNLLRYKLGSVFAPNSRGFAQYNSFVDLLNDRAVLAQNANGEFGVDAVTYEHGLFAQDNWKVNSDLTLNLGLRYEYVTTAFGFFSNAKSDINNFGPRLGFAYNPKNLFGGNLVLRGGFGLSYDQIFQNVLLNVSRNYPRVVNNVVSSQTVNGQPVFACVGCGFFRGFSNIPGTAQVNTFPQAGTNGVPAGAFFGRTPGNVPAADIPFISQRLFSPNERIKNPQSTQWTVGLQYQFGNNYVVKAEYIGTKGDNLVREVEQNFGISSALVNVARPNPGQGSILVGQGIAKSIYHSGQFTFERRLSRFSVLGANLGQLNFNANYTYSSFISESDDILGAQLNRTVPADPRDPGLDRARSGFDQPHRFVLSLVYETPEIGDNGLVRRLTGGWQISTVTTLASGTPFSILSSTNALGILPSQISTVQLSQRVSVNPNGTPGTFDITNNAGVPVYLPDAYYLIHPTNSGLLGNLGANTERTPNFYDTNLGLVKNIRTFGERQRLQLRFEVFDLFNRRNFTVVPTNTLVYPAAPTGQPFPSRAQVLQSNANFLNYGLTNVGGRTFQFGARYFF